MSRASLTADVISPRPSRIQRSSDDDDSNTNSPTVPTFPRRFPRLGSTYQLMGLPNRTDSYVSTRPSPLFMSENAPWRTHEEVQHSQKQQQQEDNNSQMPSGATKEANGPAPKSSSWSLSLSRTSGSLSSSKVESGYEQDLGNEAAEDEASTCTTSRPTTRMPVLQQQPIDKVMQDWLQQIVLWHATKLSLEDSNNNGGRPQQRRKAKKRPRSPADDEQLLLPPLPKRTATVAAAVATTTVLQHHWTGGRVYAARRRAVSGRLSDWRNPSPITILGDFRDSCHSYVTQLPDEKPADSNAVGLNQNDDDPETVWNAVLACAQTLEEQLLTCSSEIYVSQLVTLLECARRLPSPEHVFNATDGSHMVESINASLNHLNGIVQNARSYQAHLLDKLYSKREDINNEGLDVEALKDLIQRASEVLAPVVLDEKNQWLEQINQVLDWQARVDNTDTRSRNQLEVLQQLASEAAAQHCFISQSVVQLRAKLQRADELTERIESWRQEQRTESVKWVTNLVRDVERLQIQLPASEYLLQVHADMIAWMERADVAIRSRLSLQQVQELLDTTVPGVELADWCEKLRTRVASAETWLAAVRQVVPDPNPSLAWMNSVRQALENGDTAIDLHDLSCEGGRLPVQVPEAQLLQAEVEARSWTFKAAKWIPAESSSSSSSSKKPKLDELKEHMAKTASLRDLLVALPNEEERRAWVLPGEDSLNKLIEQAEEWLHTFNSVGQEEGKYLSLNDLRAIEHNGQAICVNLTPATAKVRQVLTQAEAWFAEYAHLWKRCCLKTSEATEPLEVSELKAAVEVAESSLQIDLQEAIDLEKVLTRIQEWQNSVNLATGKVSRRHKKLVLTVHDLNRLLKEAPLLPIVTTEHVENLLNELEIVSTWQAQAATRLREVDSGLQRIQQALNAMYGAPNMYTRLGQSGNGDLAKGSDATEMSEMNCSSASSSPSAFSILWNSDPCVQGIIDTFCASTDTIHIDTPESEFSTVLSAAAKWCSRSVKYLENQVDIFDKRFFGAFDRFILEGKSLIIGSDDNMEVDNGENPKGTESPELQQLKRTMDSLVGDQMQRLTIILTDRERYVNWCSVAESLVFAGEKKPSLEKLKELSMESQSFPGTSDPVHKIRKLAGDATDWALRAREAMAMETRLTYAEAKSICTEGENLGFQCDELAQLRRGLKAARSWANRANRCKADQGSIHAKDLQDLIVEHDMLLVSLPEEISKLRHAARNYCICRRPYEGFMIECDSCGDWFHGPCIGVSEARADKVDKYMCVRCCLARTYRSSADAVAGVIRKWTSAKELKKARQVAAQKHQRKVRKETKTIEKLRQEESALLQEKAALELSCQNVKDIECEEISEKANILGEGSTPSTTAQPIEVKDPVAPPIATLNMSETENDQSSKVVSSSQQTSSVTNPSIRMSAISSRLCKIVEDIQLCEDRLVELDTKSKEKESAEDLEDRCSGVLRKWCIRVRSCVLVPFSSEQAQVCRPNADGSISGAMKSVLEEASQRGLSMFEDVRCVSNAFSCMGWALRATSILRRQPHVDEVQSLVQQASLLTLPDEKGFRMLKGIAQRARSWNKKVSKAIIPIPGESRPFDLEYLRDLSNAGDDIPLYLPLESRLHTVIEDNGVRHCLCGGPSDGRFMLSCDKCEKWFHGHCVGIDSKHSPEDLEEWKCPRCTNIVVSDVSLDVERFHDKFDVAFDNSGEDDDISCSSKAPKPEEMWPPFGITLSSAKAVEALGNACCAMPDSDGDWMPGEHALAPISVSAPEVRRNQVNLPLHEESRTAKASGEAMSEFADSFSIKLISESSSSSARSMDSPTDLPDTASEKGGTVKQPHGTYLELASASYRVSPSVSVQMQKHSASASENVNSIECSRQKGDSIASPAMSSAHGGIGNASVEAAADNFQDMDLNPHHEVLVAPLAESSCE